jgi:hypothetical protein
MTMPAHAQAPAFDDRPVLATAPLKAGHAREDLSRVGDPSWDLGPAVFRENARRCHVTVHFDVLEHADVQAAMRAYLYARLNVDLPGYRPSCRPRASDRHSTALAGSSPSRESGLGGSTLAASIRRWSMLMRVTCGMIQHGAPSSSASSCRWSPISTISGITCLEAVSDSSPGPGERLRASPDIGMCARTARHACRRR